MQRNIVEILMGVMVLLAAAGFVALAYEAADMKGAGGYEISAEFGSTGGLLVGDNVLELLPGAASDNLEDGAVIYNTRDPISLTDLLGKAVFAPGGASN